MANNAEITMVFKVREDGTLVRIQEQSKKTAKAVRDLGTAQDSAAKGADRHARAMNGGVASANNSGRSMSKLLDTVGGNNSGLVAAYATLATNAFAVSAAFSMLREAAQVTQMMQGLEVQGGRTGRTLSIVANDILSITRNSISAADSMKAVSQGFAAGLTGTDLRELTQVATDASIALGRNLPDSMDRVIKGVTKLEPELLDELGLVTKSTEAFEKYARAKGKSAGALSNIEKRRAFLEAIKAEGESKFGGISAEVDVNKYDQLLSKFQNLIQHTLEWANSLAVVSGALGLLIDTSTGMIGVLGLFGSMIGKQVTGWLHSMAVASAEAAHSLNEQAIAQKNAADAALKASRVKVTSAEASLKVAGEASSKMPAAYKEMLAAREAGTLTAEQESKGLKSLERSTSTYTGKLRKLQEGEDATTDAIKRKIATYKDEISANELRILAEKELAAAQVNAGKRELANTARLERANAVRFASIKETKTANALESASSISTIPKAFSQGFQSVKAYREELKATTQATIATAGAMGKTVPVLQVMAPAINAAKVSLYGMGLALKTVGTAFMTLLPYIGIVMLAISVLEQLYNTYWKTEAEKAKEKALEELSAVLEQTTKNMKEITRVSNLDNQEGTRSAAILEIRVNSLLELADAYIKVSEASQAAIKNEAKAEAAKQAVGPKSTALQETQEKNLIDRQRKIADAAGVAFDSTALSAFSSTITKNAMGFGDWNEEGIRAIQTADQLNKLSPELAKRFFEEAEGVATFAEKQKILNKYLREAKAEYSPVRDKLAEFQEGLKSAETAQTDFLRSLKVTTPYDTALEGVQSLANAMTDLQKLSKSGVVGVDMAGEFDKLITQIGPNLAKAFTVGTQETLGSYKDVTDQVNRLNRAIEEGKAQNKSVTLLENERTAALAQQTKYKEALGSLLPEELDNYTQSLAIAQQQTILAQSQVTLAQARLSVLQRYGTVTGADVKRQMQAQNSIIALQQTQEKLKIKFIELDINKLRITIQEIEAQQKLLEELKKQGIEKDRQAQLDKLQQVRLERNLLRTQGRAGSKEDITLAAQESFYSKPVDLQPKEDELERNRRNALQQIRTLNAGVQAASNVVAALGMQMTSAIEQNTAAALQDLTVKKEAYELEKATQAASMTRMQQERQLSALVSMRADKILPNEIAAIKESALLRGQERTREYKFRIEELELQKKLADARGLPNQVRYYENLIGLETRKYTYDQAALETQTAYEILQKVTIKNEEDLIGRKQEILSYQEKILEATRAQTEAQRSLRELDVDISAKARGVTDTAATDRIKALKAAKDSYDLAKREAEIKEQQIALEFALLKAKIAVTQMEMAVARQELATQEKEAKERLRTNAQLISTERARIAKEQESAAKRNGRQGINDILVTDSPELQRLLGVSKSIVSELAGFQFQESAFKELEGLLGPEVFAGLEKALTAALSAASKGPDIASKQLELLTTEGPRVKGGFMSELANIQERKAARTKQSEVSGVPISNTNVVLDEMSSYVDQIKERLSSLGPQGEIVLAATSSAINIGNSFVDAFKTIGEGAEWSSEKTVAALQAVSAVIAGVSSILKATSDAKIANIEKEIAAEEKRDGKSAASLEKIKAMEKKKDDMARKSFNVQKKLMMAQAIVSTAAAIAMSIGQLGPIAGPIMAAVMAAMGAAQIAIIAGTSYESASPASVSTPSSLTIGKRSDTVDLAKGPNANAGGEVSYLRGSEGTGSNASNYRTVGSAYGGELMRGYGNRGFVVGEKGPEVITPETPISVTPANDVGTSQPVNATFNIQAIDSQGVQDVLVAQKGNIIKMLRQAANASGKSFMEDVNVNVYTRPAINKL